MYSYKIWGGSYDLYDDKIIYHEKKFSKGEFIAMFNEAVKNDNRDCHEVADYLVKHHGFKTSIAHMVFTIGSRDQELTEVNPETGKSEPNNRSYRTTEIWPREDGGFRIWG